MKSSKLEELSIFCSVSSKEIELVRNLLIPSLLRQTYNGQICLYLIKYKKEDIFYKKPGNQGKVKVFEIKGNRNYGFGEAINHGFSRVKPEPFFLVINPDIGLHKQAIQFALDTIKDSDDYGIVESRQLPFRHPKEYDGHTGETPWASGACILVRSTLFEKISGFDPNYWMYTEDVDLSWRAWIKGYKVIHEPRSVAYHYTGNYFEYSTHRFYFEEYWTSRNFLYLMYKFWGKEGEKKAIKMFFNTEYPTYFKRDVLNNYMTFKKGLTLNKKGILGSGKHIKNNRIKVIDFNQFHEFENEYRT